MSMGELAERLTRIRAAYRKSIPSRFLEQMRAATEELRRSGQAAAASGEGDRAPGFALPDSQGKVVRLEEVLQRGLAVVSFFRGHWCPYCNAELDALSAALPEIESSGGILLVASPQLPTHSRALRQRRDLGFEILFDRGGEVAARYGLRFDLPGYLVEVYRQLGIDLESTNDEAHWRLPIPARYIVDRDGRIRYARVDPDYTRRPEPAETVAALRRMSAP